MPGFIDVSGWTYEDVRRLGHADEADEEPRFSNRSPYRNTYYSKARKPNVVLNYIADDVWSAACAAQRINGSYLKVNIDSESDPSMNKKSNRQIVELLLADPTEISAEDRVTGQTVRKYFQGLTFKVIEGKPMNDFMKNAMTVAGEDIINSVYNLAIICSLPASYEKNSVRDNSDTRLKWARGGFLGQPGDHTIVDIEIVKKVWSTNWNTWYVTGITKEDQIVFFAFKRDIEIGSHATIDGKIKAHRDNSTQLSHVKVVK